jgi:hypothetical protein
MNDLAIRAEKPAHRNYRLFDSPGLYLQFAAGGAKWWRFRYHFDGKEKRLSPDVPEGRPESRAQRCPWN